MSRKVLTYGPFDLEFQEIRSKDPGEGKTWLAFHGFGRDASDFEIFRRVLRPGESIYSFNLFQHGRSRFPEERLRNQPMLMNEFIELVDFLLDQFGLDRFSLLGYSMGGKVALKTLESHADRVDDLLLLAPDGVKLNRWYRFASDTRVGRSMYRGFVNNPKPLFRVADVSRSLGFITPKIHKFVYHHMDTEQKRRQVGETWLIYRNFHPVLKKVQQKINEHRVNTHLLYGRFDSVIKPWQGKKLNEGLEQDSLHLLEQGHLLMNSETVDYIVQSGIWESTLRR